MADIDLDVIRERRRDIEESAPCVGCGATLASCQANRGKDPSAPPWFGCCARTMSFLPCIHNQDVRQITALLLEIESGTVRTVAETMADSLVEYKMPRMSWAFYEEDDHL